MPFPSSKKEEKLSFLDFVDRNIIQNLLIQLPETADKKALEIRRLVQVFGQILWQISVFLSILLFFIHIYAISWIWSWLFSTMDIFFTFTFNKLPGSVSVPQIFINFLSFIFSIGIYLTFLKSLVCQKHSQMPPTQMNSEDIKPLTDEEVAQSEKESKIWKEHIQRKLDANYASYMEQKDLISKEHLNKWIVFANGKVQFSTPDSTATLRYVEEDPSVFVTLVGHEDEKTSPQDVLMVSDLLFVKDKTKACFPFHQFELTNFKDSDISHILAILDPIEHL